MAVFENDPKLVYGSIFGCGLNFVEEMLFSLLFCRPFSIAKAGSASLY
jgi:hypothetical protein